jgi:hypothetical protein
MGHGYLSVVNVVCAQTGAHIISPWRKLEITHANCAVILSGTLAVNTWTLRMLIVL